MIFVFSENYPNTIIRKGKLCDSIKSVWREFKENSDRGLDKIILTLIKKEKKKEKKKKSN